MANEHFLVRVLAIRAEEAGIAKKQELFELPVRRFEMLTVHHSPQVFVNANPIIIFVLCLA